MIDRTNIGISPLMSTPMTTSYITSPGVDTTSYMTGAITQPIEYVQTSAATPQTFTTTQVVDQGFALPETTTYLPDATSSLIPQTTTTTILPDAGIATSFAPQTTLPDQALTSFIPDVTPSYLPTTDIQPISVMPDAGLQTALTTPTVSIQSPEIVSSTPLVQAAGSYTTTTLGGTPVASTLPVAGSYTTTTLGGTPVASTLPVALQLLVELQLLLLCLSLEAIPLQPLVELQFLLLYLQLVLLLLQHLVELQFLPLVLKMDPLVPLWMKISKEEDLYMMNLVKIDIEDSDLVVKINIYNIYNILI